eukprot:s2192_g3.t2
MNKDTTISSVLHPRWQCDALRPGRLTFHGKSRGHGWLQTCGDAIRGFEPNGRPRARRGDSRDSRDSRDGPDSPGGPGGPGGYGYGHSHGYGYGYGRAEWDSRDSRDSDNRDSRDSRDSRARSRPSRRVTLDGKTGQAGRAAQPASRARGRTTEETPEKARLEQIGSRDGVPKSWLKDTASIHCRDTPGKFLREKMKTVQTEQSFSSGTSALKAEIPGRLSALKTKSMKLLMATKARAVDVLELAAVKVQSLKVEAVQSLASLKAKVLDTAEEMKKGAVSRAQMLLASAKSLKSTAAKKLADAKAAAGASYAKLRKDGVRTWSHDNVQLAQEYVASSIASVDSAARSSYRNARATGLAFIESTRKSIKDRIQETVEGAKARVAAGRAKALETVDSAKAKASEARDKAHAFAKNDHVRATAVGVAGGATTLGTTGAATGLCAGTVVGAAAGVVPALFTFGLSIPVGAALGAGAGLFMGTAVGATAGALSGGAAGYGAYAKRGEIQELRTKTMSRISSGVDIVKGKAAASADYIKDRASAARTRVVEVSQAPQAPAPAQPVAMPPETQGLTLVLDSLLDEAISLRTFAVGSVMLFCLDSAASGVAVARAVATHLAARAVACAGPLGNMETWWEMEAHGASIYRSVFEELLPGIFHRVYVGLRAGSGERSAEMRVRHLLKVWRASDFYPTLYLDGLEAAAFAGALALEAKEQAMSKEIRLKLGAWAAGWKLDVYSSLDLIALERRCRNRGLFGSGSSSKSLLLQRLRVFEEYWAERSKDDFLATPEPVAAPVETPLEVAGDDLDGVPLEVERTSKSSRRRTTSVASPSRWSSLEIAESHLGGVEEDLDGEPIGVLELQQWRAAKAAASLPAPGWETAEGPPLPSMPPIPMPVPAPAELVEFDSSAIDELLSTSWAQAVEVRLTSTGRRTEATSRAQPRGWETPKRHPTALEMTGASGAKVRDLKPSLGCRRPRPPDLGGERGGRAGREGRSRRRRDRESAVPLPRLAVPSLAAGEGSLQLAEIGNWGAAPRAAAAAAAAAAANAAAFLSARSRAAQPGFEHPAPPQRQRTKASLAMLGLLLGDPAVGIGLFIDFVRTSSSARPWTLLGRCFAPDGIRLPLRKLFGSQVLRRFQEDTAQIGTHADASGAIYSVSSGKLLAAGGDTKVRVYDAAQEFALSCCWMSSHKSVPRTSPSPGRCRGHSFRTEEFMLTKILEDASNLINALAWNCRWWKDFAVSKTRYQLRLLLWASLGMF